MQSVSENWRIVQFSIRSMNLSCHLHFIRSKHIFLRLCNARLFENGPSKIFLHYHFDEKHYQLRSKNRRNSRPQLQASSCFPGISCPNTFPQAFFSGCLFHRQKQNQLTNGPCPPQQVLTPSLQGYPPPQESYPPPLARFLDFLLDDHEINRIITLRASRSSLCALGRRGQRFAATASLAEANIYICSGYWHRFLPQIDSLFERYGRLRTGKRTSASLENFPWPARVGYSQTHLPILLDAIVGLA